MLNLGLLKQVEHLTRVRARLAATQPAAGVTVKSAFSTTAADLALIANGNLDNAALDLARRRYYGPLLKAAQTPGTAAPAPTGTPTPQPSWWQRTVVNPASAFVDRTAQQVGAGAVKQVQQDQGDWW